MQLFSADPKIFQINDWSIKTLKNSPQKLLIIGPDPFISQSSPDHSPQPRIDFSYYEISGEDICSLICGKRPFCRSQSYFILFSIGNFGATLMQPRANLGQSQGYQRATIQKMSGIQKTKLLHLIYNSIFQCKQLNTVMTIGFTYTKEKKINHFRNITVPVGCSCVMKQSTRIEGFLKHFIEK